MSNPFSNNNYSLSIFKSILLIIILGFAQASFASVKINMGNTAISEKLASKNTFITSPILPKPGFKKALMHVLIHKLKKAKTWSVVGKVIAVILLLVLLLILVTSSASAGTSTAVLTVIGYAGAALIIFLILRARKRKRDGSRYNGTKTTMLNDLYEKNIQSFDPK